MTYLQNKLIENFKEKVLNLIMYVVPSVRRDTEMCSENMAIMNEWKRRS
jgi:hypothetical protein